MSNTKAIQLQRIIAQPSEDHLYATGRSIRHSQLYSLENATILSTLNQKWWAFTCASNHEWLYIFNYLFQIFPFHTIIIEILCKLRRGILWNHFTHPPLTSKASLHCSVLWSHPKWYVLICTHLEIPQCSWGSVKIKPALPTSKCISNLFTTIATVTSATYQEYKWPCSIPTLTSNSTNFWELKALKAASLSGRISIFWSWKPSHKIGSIKNGSDFCLKYCTIFSVVMKVF